MAITVGELVAIPYLSTRVHAGRAGLNREIRFAHACEMPAPWEWLGEGDLLLTSGMGLPAEPAKQVQYVRRLADAGLTGMSIGEVADLPPLSHQMLQEAERRRLPVLLTAYEVPWLAVIRAVIDANTGEDQLRLAQTARIYECLREAVAQGRSDSVLTSLGRELHCRLSVIDNEQGRVLVWDGAELPDGLHAALMRAVSEHGGRMPAAVRLTVDDMAAIAVPVPSWRRASLVVLPRARTMPDLSLLQHVATVAALEVERGSAERAQRLRLGAELLAELLDAPMDQALARGRLGEHGITDERLVLAAWGPGALDADALHDTLLDGGLEHLQLRREDATLTLLPAREGLLDDLLRALPDTARVGVSDSFGQPSHAADASRQAIWALQAASDGSRAVRYGEHHAPFLPRTLSEAQDAVERVLGPLLAYDRDNRSELVHSLRVFLSCNRSWKRAAEELFVHKQTLVYRMRRVEELTHSKLDDTQDVAELWFALRTLELAGSQHVQQQGEPPGLAS